MTDLKKLKVSLTKNGFQKIWKLISQLEIENVLDNTSGTLDGVNLNKAQVRKILSASKNDIIPEVWKKIKEENSNELTKALVFLSIIFSHVDLIDTLRKSKSHENNATGTLRRDGFLNEKAYTNFVYTMSEFGLLTSHGYESVNYDFSTILSDDLVSKYAPEIFRIKLLDAKWDEGSELIDECINNGFHEALAISEDDFKDWLEGEIIQGVSEEVIEFEDQSLDDEVGVGFKFKSGHNETKSSSIRSTKAKKGVVKLEHKKIQEYMYKQLKDKYGQENVGTEMPTGYGTLIDVAVNDNGNYVFYELKTGNNIKVCIREALPQLIEYSYWGGRNIASKLIIVSPNIFTSGAELYLETLRNEFNLPIYYQQFDLDTNLLVER